MGARNGLGQLSVNDELRVQLSRLVEIGRYDDADRLLQGAFSQSPSDADNYYYAARVASERDQLDAAREHLHELIQSSPQHFEGRVLIADVARRSGRLAEAERVLLELLSERPESPYLFACYARVMLETLHVEKARALIGEALRLSPTEPLALVLDVLVCIVEGKSAEARERLGDIVAASPQARHVAFTMITVLSNEHRYREALEIAQAVFRESPRDPELLDLVVELRARTHWVSIPAWPLQRFGYLGAIGLWMGLVMLLLIVGERRNLVAIVFLGVTYVAYCIYSWTYKPLLVRWLKWRGL